MKDFDLIEHIPLLKNYLSVINVMIIERFGLSHLAEKTFMKIVNVIRVE